LSSKGNCLRFRFNVCIRLLLLLGALFIFIPLQAQTRTQAENKTPDNKEQARPPAKEQAETKTRDKKKQSKPLVKKQEKTKIPEKKEQVKPRDNKPVKVPASTGANVEEIINISKLTKGIQKFTIKRDIFSPDIMRPNVPAPRLPTQEMLLPKKEDEKKVEQEKKSILEDEIRNNLSYEGYVVKNSKNIALVSLNGEFYAVSEGDIVDEKITIIMIEKEAITVEFDNNILEIQLKGEEQK
jgi:hypothetical protein